MSYIKKLGGSLQPLTSSVLLSPFTQNSRLRGHGIFTLAQLEIDLSARTGYAGKIIT